MPASRWATGREIFFYLALNVNVVGIQTSGEIISILIISSWSRLLRPQRGSVHVNTKKAACQGRQHCCEYGCLFYFQLPAIFGLLLCII